MDTAASCKTFFGLCFVNKIDIGMILSVILFIAGLAANSWNERRKADKDKKEENARLRRIRRRYLIALSEEVGLNVQSIEKFTQKFPTMGHMSKFLRSGNWNRPLITFTFNKTIFSSRTEILEGLSDIIIRSIVEFYGKLDEISFDCQSIEYSAFVAISFDGRDAMILDIESQSKIALQQGKSLKDAIAQHLLDTK